MKDKLESRIAGRNISNFRCADTLMAESEEDMKSFLMKVKEGSEKAVLKLNIQKTKIMASSPITSWQIDGEKVEHYQISKRSPKSMCILTADTKLKDSRSGRKAMTNLDSI